MVTHAQAREWALEGCQKTLGRLPSLLEVQFVQAVAYVESTYGQGWKNDGVGSWNMGAVQAGMPPCNPSSSFLYTDSHPNPDGTSTKYQVCFRKYPGPVEGMADVARILYVQMKVQPTSIQAVAQQMYNHHYYEGFGATVAQRIAGEVKALTSALNKITSALGEDMPPIGGEGTAGATPKAPPDLAVPVYYLQLSAVSTSHDVAHVHEGMQDSYVMVIQTTLKAKGLYTGKLDGDWGPLTEKAVRAFLGLT